MVVAETEDIAEAAIELIEVQYQSMPAVTDIYAAMADGAPQLYDCYPNNIAFKWGAGDLDGADHAIKLPWSRAKKLLRSMWLITAL